MLTLSSTETLVRPELPVSVTLTDSRKGTRMSGLSSELNSYLSKSSSSTSLSSLTSKFSSIKLPALKTPFGGGGDGGQDDEEPFLGVVSDSNGGLANNRKENQSWLARKMEENLPSLSKKQRILGFMTSLLLGNQAGELSSCN